MKSTIFFALIAASCLTSACGKDSDSKKNEPKETIVHRESGEGFCMQVVKEQMTARGLTLNGETLGACPDKTKLPSGEAVTRYATCPVTMEEGLPATFVYYNKSLNDDGEVMDMTLFTPEALCKIAAQE